MREMGRSSQAGQGAPDSRTWRFMITLRDEVFAVLWRTDHTSLPGLAAFRINTTLVMPVLDVRGRIVTRQVCRS